MPPSPSTAIPTNVLLSTRLFSSRWLPPKLLSRLMPMRKPRMLQLRIVVLSLADAPTPAANVPGPAASPPILKLLQSIVTLLVAMVMALPLLIAVDRLLRRHHVP